MSAVRPTIILLALGLTSVSLAAQTPLPGVQRGVPRQILLGRSEDQLLSLLSGPRTYTIYTFELKGSFDHATVRRWNGVMVMPRPTDLGVVGPVTLTGPKGQKITESWYKHPDGTISTILVDPSGGVLGVVSTRQLAAWAQLDLNRDGIVDFFRHISLEGRELVAAAVGDGAAFLERWRLGEARLCDPSRSKPAISDRSAERETKGLLGAAGTMPACGSERSAQGILTALSPSGPAEAVDPMDRVCEGRTGASTRELGVGPYAVLGGIIGVAAGTVFSRQPTRRPTDPGERRPADARMIEEMRREREAADFANGASQVMYEVLKPPETDKEKPAAKRRSVGRESPSIGSEGTRGGDAEASLSALCASRARAQRHWSVVHDALTGNKTDAAGTDCDDPVTDPAAADAETTMPKCGPARESQSVSEQLAAELGANQSRQCGRTERPGPDGTCRGSRNIGGNRGRLWYGWGSIIGLVPCDPRTCNPEER